MGGSTEDWEKNLEIKGIMDVEGKVRRVKAQSSGTETERKAQERMKRPDPGGVEQ